MRTSILCALLLFPILIFGQTVNHFNQSDSRWNVARTTPAGDENNPNFVETTTTIFGIQGDSLVGGQQWFKIYATRDSLFVDDLFYRGLLRTDNNKVLYLDRFDQLDTLYDFDLAVGDSAWFNLYGSSPEWLSVISIDSIQINGVYYKRQKFAEPLVSAFDRLDEVWIEGIGSMHGPLFPNFPIKFSEEMPDSSLLTCSYSANQSIYQNPLYSDCYINITLGVDNPEILNFSFYPNPFYGEIHFKNIQTETLNLTVLNSLGQVVKELKLQNNVEVIDLSELNAGVYIFRFTDENNVRVEKLIKAD